MCGYQRWESAEKSIQEDTSARFSLSLLRSLIKLGSRELPYDFYDCSLSCLILRLYFEEERGKVYLVPAVLRVHSQPRLHRTLWSWGVWYKCEPQTNNSFLTIRPPSAPKVGNPSSKTHGETFHPLLVSICFSTCCTHCLSG